MGRTSFRGLVVVGCLLFLAAACGRSAPGGTSEDDTHKTIAFLRAVPGVSPTEPTFRDELRLAGFVEGRNLTVLAGDIDEAYPSEDEAERAIARWRREGVDLIVALSSSGAAMAQRAAPETNILFISNDPMATGLVADERRPEGRLTGVTFRVPADRTLDFARRAMPGLARIGLAVPSGDPAAEANRQAVARAVEMLDLVLLVEEFTDGDDVDDAVAELARRGAEVLLVSTSPPASRVLEETREAADEQRLPVIANTSLAPWALVSIFPDSAALGRQMGRQAARLLSGSSPASVPVEDPRQFVVRINPAVAADLGIEFSEDLLREAHEVVEER